MNPLGQFKYVAFTPEVTNGGNGQRVVVGPTPEMTCMDAFQGCRTRSSLAVCRRQYTACKAAEALPPEGEPWPTEEDPSQYMKTVQTAVVEEAPPDETTPVEIPDVTFRIPGQEPDVLVNGVEDKPNYMLIGGIIAGVVVVGGSLAYLAFRKKR